MRKTGKSRSLFWKIILALLTIVILVLEKDNIKTITGNTITPSLTEKAFVTRVIDGDTVELADGRKVRLICVNTPEKNQYYYQEATDYMKQEVLNKDVLLEKDVSETDRYGRLLRYIRDTKDNHLINYDTVLNGYAKLDRFPPDIKYCNEFKQAEEKAKEEKIGIWKNS